MTPDNELPVWTIRPNWRNGILERLEWLTDIPAGTYGTEQRRALRLSPRRTFEMTFNPVDAARSYFDLWLHRLGSEEFMVPLWHDKGRLESNLVLGADAISVDTTFREFVDGGMAIIIAADPFVYDVIEIDALTDTTITALAGVANEWPAGSAIYPLRRSRISQESLLSALTNRVGEASIAFELNQANDIPDEGAWSTLYAGVPIILDKPNRREQIDLTFIRNSLLLDNEHGLRTLLDDAGRAFTVQTYLRQMRGREEHWAFRQMVYRLRGMAYPVWLPTFNRDLELSQDRLAADALLDVKKIGYAYTGGAVSGRRHILINGDLGREITGLGAAPSASEERLTLGTALGENLAAGTSASFMDICRLNADMVEITHHTDTDGVAECNLAFKAFRDERTTDGALDNPIPLTGQRTVPCGEEQPSGDAAISIVIDKSSVMNTAGRMQWAREGVAGYLEALRPLIQFGSVVDIEVRRMYSTTQALVKRAVTEADLDALIAYALGTNSGSTIIGDWRPAASGVAGFFNATDPIITDRRLYWVGRGRAAWDFMGTGGAATINAITPEPSVGCFIYAGGGNTHALLIDDTPSDGIPEFDPSEITELTDAMLAL